MDPSKRHATVSQVNALAEFMQEHPEFAKGTNSGLEREDLDAQWRDLAANLNGMGGAVKSVEKWRQTWRDLKCNTKKRALKHQLQGDVSLAQNVENNADTSSNDTDQVPSKKRCVSFDEEIIRIEKDKLELDREYKTQKIEVLSRIASALEELARRRP